MTSTELCYIKPCYNGTWQDRWPLQNCVISNHILMENLNLNAGLLSIGPLGTNLSEILMKIQNFSLTKIHLKTLSAKWRPFCSGGDELNLVIMERDRTEELQRTVVCFTILWNTSCVPITFPCDSHKNSPGHHSSDSSKYQSLSAVWTAAIIDGATVNVSSAWQWQSTKL